MCRPNKNYLTSTHKCHASGTPNPIDKTEECVYFDTEDSKPLCRYGDTCNCVESIQKKESD